MLDSRILGLIDLSAGGVTNGQLLWRLTSGGTRYDASELLDALGRLARSGEIQSDGKRWRSVRSVHAEKADVKSAGSSSVIGNQYALSAAPATLGRTSFEPATQADNSGQDEILHPARLLQYYAATQRRDPRGSVEAFPDGHGVKWHLFDCRGRWWDGAEVVIRSVSLCPGFLQAVAEAGESGAAAVGWPVAVFRDPTGTVCVPALLLPASWALDDTRFTVTVDAVQPALNPVFVRHAKRLTGLSEDVLARAMEGGEDGISLETIGRRLAQLLARIGGQVMRPGELADHMGLSGDGVRNAAALFLPEEGSFTRRVAEDLDQIAEWPAERLAGTALNVLLSSPSHQLPITSVAAVVEVNELTEKQFLAADAALSGTVTAIQGPPGTGKSQTILSLICSAIAADQSVLFVARNHRALDEVEKRLGELLPDASAMVRARDADGERDTSMLDILVELANGNASDQESSQAAADRRTLLTDLAQTRVRAFRTEAERTRLHLALSDLVEREESLLMAYAEAGVPTTRLRSFLEWLRDVFSFKKSGPTAPVAKDARPAEIRRRIHELRRRLASLPSPTNPAFPNTALHLPPLVKAIEKPEEATLQYLRSRKSEIDFARGGSKMRHVTSDDASLLLRYRPVWAASTLSVPARIPLAPGLFDLAIFDEASQCDIASAMPILARAKRAIIVGDPEQLSFIPTLGNAQEHALMDAADLPRKGRGTWAQSRNSLFDFVRGRIGADALHLLPDQFRSAPAIVEYTSDVFYGGRLRPGRSDDEFRAPVGYRAGLHWENIKGACAREDGGNINQAEAAWIAQRIFALAAENSFEGTVGVVSPFTAQVGLIRRLTAKVLAPEARKKLSLVIDTVDSWQGGEADIIFFSLAVGPGAASSAISFLSRERRRFNVAISRAKAVATIVGDLDWARKSGIPHVEILADRATREPTTTRRGFDSKWERRVYEALRGRGLDPQPQYPIGSRSLDFALFHESVRLDLEVDGRKWHMGAGGERKVADRIRDRELIARGWKVRRFWVDELSADMEGCLDIVERDLGHRA